jgi:NADH-quinone oxidoreductase subunit I
VTTS